MQRVTNPRKDVEKVSPETIRRRMRYIYTVVHQEFGSGGEDFMIGELIRKKGQEERAELLREMGLTQEMSEEDGLAMLVDLGSTWSAFRKWKR